MPLPPKLGREHRPYACGRCSVGLIRPLVAGSTPGRRIEGPPRTEHASAFQATASDQSSAPYTFSEAIARRGGGHRRPGRSGAAARSTAGTSLGRERNTIAEAKKAPGFRLRVLRSAPRLQPWPYSPASSRRDWFRSYERSDERDEIGRAHV